MEEYPNRVVIEKEELDDKSQKLMAFIYHDPIYQMLPIEEKLLFDAQYNVMKTYSNILGVRITKFQTK